MGRTWVEIDGYCYAVCTEEALERCFPKPRDAAEALACTGALTHIGFPQQQWQYLGIQFVVDRRALAEGLSLVLARRNMEWVVLVAPVAIFAVNIIDYLKII